LNPNAPDHREVAFFPARVLMQDFAGVPAVVNLAAMRDALEELKGDLAKIDPLVSVDVVIDHSVIARFARGPDSSSLSAKEGFEQNPERYQLLKLAQQSFNRF
jgi:aconitate hydratase